MKARVDSIIHEENGELKSIASMQGYYNNMKMLLQEAAGKYGARIRLTRAMREIDKRAQAINEWVTSERRQLAPVRVLGRLGGEDNNDIDTGVYNWRRNMTTRQMEPAKGTYLDINPSSNWAGAINQGWVQGAIDRGHIFYLLTPVPQWLVNIHNEVARHPTEENIGRYKNEIRDSNWKHRGSVYAKELILCARNQYFIHGEEDDTQIVSGAAP